MKVTKQIRALTSLRFIAATMIVLHHSRGQFGIPLDWAAGFLLVHGVTFFFVLSGFILVYVYPVLPTRNASWRFIIIRVGRIWPAHFAAFLFLLLLFPDLWKATGSWQALTNILMLHAWIPLPSYFLGFNSPSWSISTEFFFYLCFPFLIFHFKRRWLIMLAFSLSLLVILIIVTKTMGLPYYQPGVDTLSIDALLFIHPFAHLFEFLTGMGTAHVFQRIPKNAVTLNKAMGTAIELTAIGLVGTGMYYLRNNIVSMMIACVALLFGFGLLIVVMALEKGYISQLLSYRIPVILGEISYSVYLVHQILIRYHEANAAAFPAIPGWVAYMIFWSVLLMFSYMSWFAIERPCRNFVAGWSLRKMSSEQEATKKWRPFVLDSGRLRLSLKTALFMGSLVIASIFLATALVRSPFAQKVPKELYGISFAGGGKCAVDFINNHPDKSQPFKVLRCEGFFYVNGWAFDDVAKQISSVVMRQLAQEGKSYYAVASKATKRPDLIPAYGISLEDAGFEIDGNITDSGPNLMGWRNRS